MTVNEPSTPETAPDGPQERPEGRSATPVPPESLSGPQKGAESLRLRERHVHVVIRHRDAYTANRQALSLVDWINAEFPELDVTTDAREWPAHNTGPTTAECAAHDRAYWTDKHAGEGQ